MLFYARLVIKLGGRELVDVVALFLAKEKKVFRRFLSQSESEPP